jgi:hypothetical protein
MNKNSFKMAAMVIGMVAQWHVKMVEGTAICTSYLQYQEKQNGFVFGTVCNDLHPSEQEVRERMLYLRWWE